jgi:hypothetical protein
MLCCIETRQVYLSTIVASNSIEREEFISSSPQHVSYKKVGARHRLIKNQERKTQTSKET